MHSYKSVEETKNSNPTLRIYKKYAKGAAIEGRKNDFPLYSHREVKNEAQQVRYYPDEWLIVTALQKYIHLRQPVAGKKVIVVAEKWAGNGNIKLGNSVVPRNHFNDDEGGENTLGFNDDILKAVEKASQEDGETLILVPYLLDWHHPGLAIQVKNKTLIYLDPVGGPPKRAEVLTLQKSLAEKNFDIQFVKAAQQKGGTICGFVLTASMMKFIEEFLLHDVISVKGFETNKPYMNTAYMFQIYINNLAIDNPTMTNEIMIAERNLWLAFLQEQKQDKFQIIESFSSWNLLVDDYLNMVFLLNSENEEINLKKLNLINIIQSKFIELIFTRSKNLELQIENLIQFGLNLLTVETVVEFEKCFDEIKDNFKLANLLSPHCIENTKAVLKLGVPSLSVSELLKLSLFKNREVSVVSAVSQCKEVEVVEQILSYVG